MILVGIDYALPAIKMFHKCTRTPQLLTTRLVVTIKVYTLHNYAIRLYQPSCFLAAWP
ncbi:Uncharacterized protein APZ42_019341 [Daphnia magna]|uniref:Uncharacterized protein n=1 Tax=Daphnia magna TaxID=35525 RepID=A0A164YHM0_9CRUS|nr:Uncharacterized protein APZ42_019341 [Daphnia magna]